MTDHGQNEFKREKHHLENTKQYLEDVLAKAANDQDAFQGNIKHAMEELDHLDSSLSYVNILANANLLDMADKNFRNLVNVREKPYFSRIDFTPKHTGVTEQLYIGKASLYTEENHDPVIVDWRSPIANLYYEGQIGEAGYEAHGQMYEGELSLKRQYTIEKGQLEDMRDIDVTARDEMLQEALTTNADKRLKDIVSTIQAEQNRIIRADMHKPVIVQGVAGSGKTTIAMHRIAYFIYTYAETFNPDEMMILAPNHLFLDYISDVLPELGVEDVKQTTFTDFFLEAIGKKYTFTPYDEKLLVLVEQTEADTTDMEWIAGWKGSLEFKDVLERYVKAVEKELVPSEDVTLERFVLFKGERSRELFEEQYAYMPAYQRLDKIKEVIKKSAKTRQKEIFEQVEEIYDNKIEKYRHGVKDPEERRQKVVETFDRKEAHMVELKELSKTAVSDYVKQFSKKKVHDYYKELMKDTDMLVKYSDGSLDKKDAEKLAAYHEKRLKGNKLEYEDAAPLLYLKHLLYGVKLPQKIKNVVIDEAQDYSIFQIYMLKHVLGTDLFTMLGDLSQGIHSYRSIQDWQQVLDHIFPKATYTELEQSYRTTKEIMEVANQVISYSKNKDLPRAKPVVRRGDVPAFYHFVDMKELGKRVKANIAKWKEKNIESMAIVTKTNEEAKVIAEAVNSEIEEPLQMLKEDEVLNQEKVQILPSYLSKGLEFDGVMLITTEERFHPENELDIKLLYVAMTRALHQLDVFTQGRYHDDLLEEVGC
ncbi:DNA helicase-2/ATP-dependent DNA helicase PcrA [Salibacterium salarium]|uniref:RNA polymerase recycling motor HelD n=1 Tax=Salibacterium salarium TaxID=284579 RepID=UPI00277E821D|nr:RNA polymerase recycling motor HelD [Salibacterium salarium]MDQ0300009.1 DNA helicase-2/ATP-dependent DNA helicase PcrA [Salibacterium salarium]